MDRVKDFISNFFEIEIKARTADLRRNRKLAEKLIAEFYSFCDDSIKNKLGIISGSILRSDSFYDDYKDKSYDVPRYVFKISQYQNVKLSDVYIVFSSAFHFDNDEDYLDFYEISEFFIVSKIDNQFKIIKTGVMDPDNRPNWIDEHGVKDISIHSLGKFVSTERYLEPKDDEDSMKKYLADE